MAQFDLILRGGTVATADATEMADVGIVGGKIAAIGDLSQSKAASVVDVSGLTLLPGVMDSQVHFREPGPMHKEDLESGSRGAVLGGVTAVFEMPNTSPVMITPELLQDKLNRAANRMHSDYAFWFGGSVEHAAQLTEWERLPGTPGVKIFMGSSTGDLLVPDDEGLRKILSHTKRRVAVHSEDEPRLNARKGFRVEGDPSSHPVWRDEEAAMLSTQRLVRIAREVGAKVHVLHISTAQEMDFLMQNKDVASVEVLPNHLTLSAPECYERLGTYAQMNPPVRGLEHQKRLWQAVNDGTVDVLGSDHAPHTRAEKDQPYPASPSGMTGVQTLVPIMLNHIAQGRTSLKRFIEISSRNPSRLFGMKGKGEIAVGYDADFTIVDLKRREVINNSWIASKAGWTPFDGDAVTGWPIHTIVRGQWVVRDGALIGTGLGKAVEFQ